MTADINIKDGSGADKYIRFPSGDGSSGSPAQGYGADILAELQSILAKIIAAPSTEAKQDTANAALAAIQAAVEGTVAVSLTTQPLPTGAASEATLATLATQVTAAAIRTAAEAIQTAVEGTLTVGLPTNAATQTTLAALLTELEGKADLAETQPVSAASLPLPSGAASESTLVSVDAAVEAVQAAVEGVLDVDVTAVPALPSAPIYGQTTVTTAGTAVVLRSTTGLSQGVTIKAPSTNAGNIFVGGALVTSANGFVLEPGEQVFVSVDDTDAIYIDAAENGEGVSYVGS